MMDLRRNNTKSRRTIKKARMTRIMRSSPHCLGHPPQTWQGQSLLCRRRTVHHKHTSHIFTPVCSINRHGMALSQHHNTVVVQSETKELRASGNCHRAEPCSRKSTLLEYLAHSPLGFSFSLEFRTIFPKSLRPSERRACLIKLRRPSVCPDRQPQRRSPRTPPKSLDLDLQIHSHPESSSSCAHQITVPASHTPAS
jgi:hypothetical protein